MNPKWYPGYYLDPQHWPEWMPDVMEHWLPASLVRMPPAIPPQSWPEPSSKPSFSLYDGLTEQLQPKSFEERLAALPFLLPPKLPDPSAASSSGPWGGLLPRELGSQPAPWPDAATAASLPPLFPRWPDYVQTTSGVPAKIAGWPWDVPGDLPVQPAQWRGASASQPPAMPPAPPVPHRESANSWGASSTPTVESVWNSYLAPVPPAPDWNEVPTNSATATVPMPERAEPVAEMPQSILGWLQSARAGGGMLADPARTPVGFPAAPVPTVGDDPFERAAARTRQSVRPTGGRRKGVATFLLESYAPHVLEGLLDTITTPMQPPVPMPKGLAYTDAGQWVINGVPAHETDEGRTWLADQQRRRDWPAAMAMLMLTFGRLPGGAPQGAIGVNVGQKSPAFPHSKAKVAEEMEAAGRSWRDIVRETGLDRGTDGQWRFEISDKGYRVRPYAGTLDADGFRNATLFEHHDHPGLRKAYPHMAAIKSRLRIDPHRQPFGEFDPSSNTLTVSAQSPTQARTYGIHELNHPIQHYEKHARGGSPEEFLRENPNLSFNEAHQQYLKLAGEAEARAAEDRLRMNQRRRRLAPYRNTEEWAEEGVPRDQQIIKYW